MSERQQKQENNKRAVFNELRNKHTIEKINQIQS